MSPRTEGSTRFEGFLLTLVLLLGIGVALLGHSLPEGLPATAPPERFAAGRGLRLLERIAARPHPVGSEAHACVLEELVAELTALGLEPELQEGRLYGSPLTNVLARVKGLEPTGTVLCVAHYDSVPTGPGAGDDGLGVASWLETLRALRAGGWRPRNDVVLLLSDGEELGLLGAELFVRENPLIHAVTTVVNLEAIGNGGPAVLFQLGPRNGARVRLFASEVPRPVGTSLADAVYRRMRNDTDLSAFLRHGISGFNLAVASGNAAYHAPHDTPAELHPRSLQHMGESAMALLETLGGADLRRLDGPDVTFFDVLGRTLLVWPRTWDPFLAGLAWLLVAAVAWRARARPRVLAEELLVHPLECALVGCLLFAARFPIDRGLGLLGPTLDQVPGNTTAGALSFVAATCGTAVLVARRARREAQRRRDSGTGEGGTSERQLAGLLWLALATGYALLALRGAAFLFSIPLALAALSRLVEGRRGALATPALAVLFALALGLGLPIAASLLQLFQRAPDHALAVAGAALAFFAVPFLPQLSLLERASPWTTRGLLALALACLVLSSVVARVLVWRQGALWP